ncbi:hypothetical protein DL93DRAFT_2080416, partial [Clavulina sp. PMI_390]
MNVVLGAGVPLPVSAEIQAFIGKRYPLCGEKWADCAGIKSGVWAGYQKSSSARNRRREGKASVGCEKGRGRLKNKLRNDADARPGRGTQDL